MQTALNSVSQNLIAVPHITSFPWIHRDLSWLQFNERVLAEASSDSNPLLERAKFLGISSNNLDEFFMIRYASLVRSLFQTSKSDKVVALNLIRIQKGILETVQRFSLKQSHILSSIQSELNSVSIHLGMYQEETPQKFDTAQQIFRHKILPALPQPEPFSRSRITTLQNLQSAILFEEGFWIKIPKQIPSLNSCVNESIQRLDAFFTDDLLLQFLAAHLGFKSKPTLIRLTRDGDFTADLKEEDTESIPDAVRQGLGNREKGRAIRLQLRGKRNRTLMSEMLKALKLSSSQAQFTNTTFCLSSLMSIKNHIPEGFLTKFQLTYRPLAAVIPRPFQDSKNIFSKLDQKDFLLHHPYDSFDAFVLWINTACLDPEVIQIDQTIYRMDALSPIIPSLKEAAKTKKVRVVIELRARFDELNNLRLTEELRKAGVEVTFGFGKLKLHGKVALITKQCPDNKLKYYAHLSTGNYNATTARQYTDLAILTSNPEVCADVKYFFDEVWAGRIPKDFKCLVSAPTKLHKRLLSYIQNETEAAKNGKKARIVAKVNALIDESVIAHLYRASQAGVKVDLIVRGTCSLIPGIKGLSENIRVISIVDRYLEHSRIYYFYNAKKIFLSSADWMPRNFFSRLELAFPVNDPEIYRYIEQILIPAYLADTEKARELGSDGKWRRRKPTGIRSQEVFEKLATLNYAGTSLWRRYYGHS
jgi:polyphosphate kinase